MRDIRFAFRMLAKSPGFTLVAITTLALAIGANSSIFALVHALAIKPLVPGEPAPVVSVFNGRAEANRDYRRFSWAELQALRTPNAVFSDVAGLSFTVSGVADQEGEVRRLFSFFATENIMSLLDAQPAVGRFFSPAETQPSASVPVVVVSYGMWQRLGGTADVIGTSLRINSRVYTIIGATPRGFGIGNAMIAPEIWLPFGMHDQFRPLFDEAAATSIADPDNYDLVLMGRLQSGLTIETATPHLIGLNEILADLDTNPVPEGRFLEITPPSRFSISDSPEEDGPIGLLASMMMGMSGIVLVVASLNLANMMLARGAARTREFAVRLAIGASRGMIVRQLLIEGLVLAIAGGLAGLLLSLWANDLLLHSLGSIFSTLNFSFLIRAEPNPSLLLATFGFCVLATLLFSLMPALRASKPNLVEGLKSNSADSNVTGTWNRFFSARHVLVMAQIALSLVLVFSAGLFVQGAINAGGLDRGFDADHGVLTELDYSLSNTPDSVAKTRLLDIRDRVANSPGIKAASFASLMPFGAVSATNRIMRADQSPNTSGDPDAPAPGFGGFTISVSPGFFDSMDVPLLQGRDFTNMEARDAEAPPAIIIDQTMAEKLFPEGNALGQRVRRVDAGQKNNDTELEIVGICAPFLHDVFSDETPRRVFFPFAQSPRPSGFLITRGMVDTRESAIALIPTTRQIIQSVDTTAPILNMTTVADFVDKNIGLWVTRIGAVMFGLFGLVALALAAIGIYGVKAYAVTRRTREIGIHMALGARPYDVFALIMNQGAKQTFVGLGFGILLCFGAGQLLASILYRVSPFDPLVLSSASVILSTVTLFACFLPARRATRINPMTAMRSE